jgi:hypothetical protein
LNYKHSKQILYDMCTHVTGSDPNTAVGFAENAGRIVAGAHPSAADEEEDEWKRADFVFLKEGRPITPH